MLVLTRIFRIKTKTRIDSNVSDVRRLDAFTLLRAISHRNHSDIEVSAASRLPFHQHRKREFTPNVSFADLVRRMVPSRWSIDWTQVWWPDPQGDFCYRSHLWCLLRESNKLWSICCMCEGEMPFVLRDSIEWLDSWMNARWLCRQWIFFFLLEFVISTFWFFLPMLFFCYWSPWNGFEYEAN